MCDGRRCTFRQKYWKAKEKIQRQGEENKGKKIFFPDKKTFLKTGRRKKLEETTRIGRGQGAFDMEEAVRKDIRGNDDG